jgi:hypothetical protein
LLAATAAPPTRLLVDRISAFFETLFQDFHRRPLNEIEDYTLIVVSHGISVRLFLMRWFHWTIRDFEKLQNPSNCTPIVLTRKGDSLLYELDAESWEALGVGSETLCPVNQFQYSAHYLSSAHK